MSVCPMTTAITHNATLVPLKIFFAYSTRVLYWARITFYVPRAQQLMLAYEPCIDFVDEPCIYLVFEI